MNKIRKSTAILWVALALPIAACQKLETMPRPQSTLAIEPLAFHDAIPLEYGQLVSVTSVEGQPYVALLWFSKPDQTIVGLRVNVAQGWLDPDALMIPRR